MSEQATQANQVERVAIIERVAAGLRDLAQPKPLLPPIINLHGISGIGKTSAVRQLFEHFRHDYPAAWLGFDPADQLPETAGLQSLHQVAATLSEIPTLTFLLDTLGDSSAHATRPASDEKAFFAASLDRVQEKPLLLLLDALDDVLYWNWLQGELLRPLVEGRRALIICTSQSPLFWRFWELRSRCEPIELPPFSVEETGQFLEVYRREPLAAPVFELTHGYPLALSYLMQRLDSGSYGDPKAIDLAALAPEAREVVSFVGAMRLVDVPVAQELMRWATGSPPTLDRLWSVLTELYPLTAPYRRGMLGRFDPALRRAVAATYGHEHYIAVCQQLEAIYYDLAAAQPAMVQFFIEWLYYSATVAVVRQQIALAKWDNQLSRLFAAAQTAGPALALRFFGDREVIEQLDAAGRLAQVQALMKKSLPNDSAAFTRALGPQLDAAHADMVGRLAERVTTNKLYADLKAYFGLVIEISMELGGEFDLMSLQHHVQRNTILARAFPPEQLDQVASLLSDRGLLIHDPTSRRYSVHPLLRGMSAYYASSGNQP